MRIAPADGPNGDTQYCIPPIVPLLQAQIRMDRLRRPMAIEEESAQDTA